MNFDRSETGVLRRCSPLLAALGIGLGLGSASAAAARDISVAPGESVQAAIDAAIDDDHIVVQPGTYREVIDFLGKGISVESAAGPAVTILDGGGLDTVVRLVNGELQNSVLRGFTITGGMSEDGGGGIRILNGSPTIVGNIITGNRAPFQGGAGIRAAFASPLIQGNRIVDNDATPFGPGGGILLVGDSQALIIGNEIAQNRAGDGGGISLFSSGRTRVEYNIVRDNRALASDLGGGGGINVYSLSLPQIDGNLIVRNSAPVGGGIGWLLPDGLSGPLLTSNTIADNDSPIGSAVAANGSGPSSIMFSNVIVARDDQTAIQCINVDPAFPPDFFFNDIYSPRGAALGGVSVCDPALARSSGNQSVDPQFVDAAAGNYHLALGSPAIDAGDPLARGLKSGDLDRNPRILDGDGDGRPIVDQGAYELLVLP